MGSVGPESRNVAAVLGTAFLTVGPILWLSTVRDGWIPGAILIAFGILVFSSLLAGWPTSSLRADVESGSTEGIPWAATKEYSVDQLRQIVPHFNGARFDEHDLLAMIPKTTRRRIIPFHEPFANFQWRPGVDVMLETGELEVVSYNCWRATGKKPPRRALRLNHGT